MAGGPAFILVVAALGAAALTPHDARAEPAAEDDVAEEDPEPAIEVLVEGVAPTGPQVTLEKEEIRRLPGAFGDPFRAVEALPGVTPTVSGLPFFFVRGAPPGNVGHYLDGVSVPHLFHALGGPAVIHPRLVEEVHLYPGAYPLELGRYAGGIVSGETTEPSDEWHAEGSLRLIDAGAFVEGGFDEGRGSVLVAGRHSYTGAVFSAISPDVTLDYRDFQARITYDPAPRDRLTLLAFGSYDYYSTTSGGIERPLFATEFYRVDARYDTRLVSGGHLRVAVTSGFDNSLMNDGRRARNLPMGSRVILRKPLGEHLALDVGFDVQIDRQRISAPPYVDPEDPVNVGYTRLFRSRDAAAAATWVGLDIRPAPGISMQPGVRVEGFLSGADRAMAVDPRLRVIVAVHERVRLVHAVGSASQPPSYLVPIPGMMPANLDSGLQRALQASAGAEVDLPLSTLLTVNLFQNVFLDLTDTVGGAPALTIPHEVPRSLGSSKGIEIYLRRSLSKRLGGFIAYTFSRSMRSLGRRRFAAGFDRPHVFQAALGYDFGDGWIGGTRFNIHSGSPIMRAEGYPVVDEEGALQRDPPHHRFDFRFEKRWQLPAKAFVAVVFEVVNATFNREEVHGVTFPAVVLPSLGVEGGI